MAMAESRFVSSDEIVVDQLKLNAKSKNTTKSTETWLSVLEKWANERNSTLNWRSTSMKISIKSYKCFTLKNIINKKSYDRECISWYMVTRDVFLSSQIALACGSCNFENLKNITRVHISRNALAFIRFFLYISQPLTLPHLENYRKLIKSSDKIKQTSIYKNIFVTFGINQGRTKLCPLLLSPLLSLWGGRRSYKMRFRSSNILSQSFLSLSFFLSLMVIRLLDCITILICSFVEFINSTEILCIECSPPHLNPKVK